MLDMKFIRENPDIVRENSVVAGPFHPAFGELVFNSYFVILILTINYYCAIIL